MKQFPIYHNLSRSPGGVLPMLLAAVLLLLPGAVLAQTISDECADCHNVIYQDWKASGHPYKLMKGDIAQNRPITLPEDYIWDEISYVIGGYKWKSRYMDENGYIITQGKDLDNPGNNQFNYLVGFWSNYHSDEENGTKPYDCGVCHTTGWVPDEDAETDNDLTDNQDGLPGIHGTFEQGGIQCVQCHGGSQHADLGNIDRSADACGACHYRTAAPGDENLIPASGGWIKHHEQYNEHLAGPHAEADCVMCHDPHKRGEYSIWEEGAEGHEDGAVCGVNCHSSKGEAYAMTTMADYGVTCEDCHMPFATKSAQPQGPFMGDVMTHIFYINTDPVEKSAMFTEDGSEVVLDSEGKAAVTLDFACKRCHQTATVEELSKFAKGFHDSEVGLANVGLNPGLTGTWWNGDRSGEGFVIDFGYSNDVMSFFGSFYTYDTAGNQIWMTFLPADGMVPPTGTSMTVNVYITAGGVWGDAFDPAAVGVDQFGTGTFTFPTCETGSITIVPSQAYVDLGFTALSYNLTRDLLISGVSCPKFVNNEGTAVAAN